MIFLNRVSAGQLLAERLQPLAAQDPIVFALPRGGVPIGYEIARLINAPLEVLVVRKIGVPFNPEYGIGAITEDGYSWIDSEAVSVLGLSSGEIEFLTNEGLSEVNRRVKQYRRGRPLPSLHQRTVIVVDDGLATGVTARVACSYLKSHGAKKVILAVPVGASKTVNDLRNSQVLDEVICLQEPEPFYAVGQFYQDFEQISDEEVISLLKRARSSVRARQSKRPQPDNSPIWEEVSIRKGLISLPGTIRLPASAKGIVLFAHGSGSSRLSPRNQQVSGALLDSGLGTLLFDLLTEEESLDRSNVFDIPLLASRLILATRWVQKQEFTKNLPIGYFGASTGAGAALWAAAELKHEISAIVSRGGRPDLAIPKLQLVTAPTLLIVGGNDELVIEMNQEALKYLSLANLVVIPGATHLFEELGALEQVSQEAISWFLKYMGEKFAQKAA